MNHCYSRITKQFIQKYKNLNKKKFKELEDLDRSKLVPSFPLRIHESKLVNFNSLQLSLSPQISILCQRRGREEGA